MELKVGDLAVYTSTKGHGKILFKVISVPVPNVFIGGVPIKILVKGDNEITNRGLEHNIKTKRGMGFNASKVTKYVLTLENK